jgi:hypothetical protein
MSFCCRHRLVILLLLLVAPRCGTTHLRPASAMTLRQRAIYPLRFLSRGGGWTDPKRYPFVPIQSYPNIPPHSHPWYSSEIAQRRRAFLQKHSSSQTV